MPVVVHHYVSRWWVIHLTGFWSLLFTFAILAEYCFYRRLSVCMSVCLFVSIITQKFVREFSWNWEISRLYIGKELVKFRKLSRTLAVYFIIFVDSPILDWCEKWKVKVKVKLGKPVTAQCGKWKRCALYWVTSIWYSVRSAGDWCTKCNRTSVRSQLHINGGSREFVGVLGDSNHCINRQLYC